MKIKLPLKELCMNLPIEFVDYLEHVRNIEFEAKPEYKYLKKIFRRLFLMSGYDFDYRYDWVE